MGGEQCAAQGRRTVKDAAFVGGGGRVLHADRDAPERVLARTSDCLGANGDPPPHGIEGELAGGLLRSESEDAGLEAPRGALVALARSLEEEAGRPPVRIPPGPPRRTAPRGGRRCSRSRRRHPARRRCRRASAWRSWSRRACRDRARSPHRARTPRVARADSLTGSPPARADRRRWRRHSGLRVASAASGAGRWSPSPA